MAFMSSVDVSKSQLAIGIMGSVDAGSMIGQSITLTDDITRANAKLAQMTGLAQARIRSASAYAVELAKGEGAKVVQDSKAVLFQDVNSLFTLSRDQTIQSAGGYRVTGSILGLEAKLYSIINHVDLKTKAVIDIPSNIAALKVQRYYNKLIGYNSPAERDFAILVANGSRTLADFVSNYQTDSALSDKDAQNVANIRSWQIGKPSLQDAWYMSRRGLKPDSYFYNIAKLGMGWSDVDAKVLYQYFYYTFSPMEIFRISDLMPVPATWIAKKLDALGFSDDDKLLVATMIQNRTTKDEVNQAWNILADNYAWGLQTEDQLTAFLTENHVPDVQVKAKLVVAELLREKVILKLLRDAEIYLYRKEVLSEELLLTHLQSLNLELAVANAIVRNEAAKKGIDWEIPE